MIRKLSHAAAAAVLVASPVLADTWVIDKNHSEAGFQVRHMMSKVRGHFNDYAGTIVVDPAKPDAATIGINFKPEAAPERSRDPDVSAFGSNPALAAGTASC